MSDPRHRLGETAETTVAEWLTRAGWTIVARRLRVPGVGEIDLLAIDGDRVLVAIEVRARRTVRTGSAETTIDRRRVVRVRRSLAAVAGSAPVHRGLRVDLVTAAPLAGAAPRWVLRRTPDLRTD